MLTADQILERLAAFERCCRDRRVRVTVQRRAIFDTVLRRDDHPTAEHIYGEVASRLPGVSRTTVYRVLEMLVQLDVITRACHPGGGARFDANVDRHHHLVCLRCGRMEDILDRRLDRLTLPDTSTLGFAVLDHRVELRGLCKSCQRQGGGRKRHGTTRDLSSGGAVESRRRVAVSPTVRSKK